MPCSWFPYLSELWVGMQRLIILVIVRRFENNNNATYGYFTQWCCWLPCSVQWVEMQRSLVIAWRFWYMIIIIKCYIRKCLIPLQKLAPRLCSMGRNATVNYYLGHSMKIMKYNNNNNATYEFIVIQWSFWLRCWYLWVEMQ